jgi:hypothetical protein
MSVSVVLPYMFRSLTLTIFRGIVPVAMLLSALLSSSQLYLGMWLYFLFVLLSCVPSRCTSSLLTPWSRVLPEKLTVNFAASQEIPRIMELESSSPYPQVPATCPFPEPTPSSPHDPLQLPEDPS